LKRADDAYLAPRTPQPANVAVGRPVDASRVVIVELGLADPTPPVLLGE
jgi:hypothetical protein